MLTLPRLVWVGVGGLLGEVWLVETETLWVSCYETGSAAN